MGSSNLQQEVGQAITIPSLRKQPSYDRLVNALEGLAIKHNTWNASSSAEDSLEEPKAVHQFLLSVISSDLAWFDGKSASSQDSATRKEIVLDLAGKRMAERCGRSAMPEMVRTWMIPSSDGHPDFEFEIREPALTGDKIGLKTWGTAFAISKKLEYIGENHFGHLFKGPSDRFTNSDGSSFTRPDMRVLELGSGTGLVGIAIAAIWRCEVVLTDLPEIEPNLTYNVQKNARFVETAGGTTISATLDWKLPDGALSAYGGDQFEAVIAADPLYDDEHPGLVAMMFKKHLKYNRNSRALAAIPMRDKNTKNLCSKFINEMREYGLQIMHQGEEIFYDDWASSNDGGVKCWWSVWGWAIPWTG